MRQRVLIVGPDYFDTVVDSYRRCLSPYYDVQAFDPFELVSPKLRHVVPGALARGVRLAVHAWKGDPSELNYRRLLKLAATFAPDIVVVCAIQALPPHVVAGFRSSNARAKVIGVFSDHIGNFERGQFFNADYDALFFKDRYIVDKLRAKLGWKHIWYLPQACDPELHRPVELTPAERAHFECDITVAGNPRPFRMAQIEALKDYDVKMWGAPIPRWIEHPARRFHQGSYVAGLEKSKAMRAARIVFNATHYAEIQGTNKRTFEVAAMGAFQITDAPAVAEFFDTKTEVAEFTDQQDMLDKIEYYLGRPELRASMAERAHVRAHAEHTYAHRWAAHLEALGLALPAEFPVAAPDLRVRAQ